MKSIPILSLIICFTLLGCNNSSAQNVSENTFGFDDLNNYALLDVFDTLRFEELLLLADMNSKFRTLITRHHITNKFRVHERILKVGAKRNADLFNETKIEFDDNSIIINDPVILLRLFRNFGHLIPRILFIHLNDGTANSSIWCDRALGYINEYCSDTLEELMLVGKNFSIHGFRKPFKQLNTFWINAETLSSEIHSLNEIFPSLQYFGMKSFERIKNRQIFKQHFPHLMHVKFSERNIAGIFPLREQHEFNKYFLELNPQIRSIQTIFVETIDDYELLRNISEKMQDLEAIHITFSTKIREFEERNQIGPIYFKNVNKFYLIWGGVPNSVTFDQLEEMSIITSTIDNLDTERISNLLRFITKHRMLKVLNTFHEVLSLQQYISIIESLPNLVEISAYSSTTDDEIFDLMRSETSLKRITIYTYQSALTEEIIRRNARIPQWKIESEFYEEMDEFMLERISIGGGEGNSFFSAYYSKMTFVKA